jgi:hypothetical protein
MQKVPCALSVTYMMQRTKENSVATALEVLYSCAERELAAFARAVEELFGPEQARLSIEDWMEELESMDWRSQMTVGDLRGLTIAATVRLASRVVSKNSIRRKMRKQGVLETTAANPRVKR